jgi:nucleotide-binding universal stress UspA family protein
MDDPNISLALDDFRSARQQAAVQELMARLTGKSVALLSFEEVRHKLRASAMSEKGLLDIPLDAIVGTESRDTDFTRTFLPRDTASEQRWARVKAASANLEATGLAPIQVYKIGDAYFVRDGHHRVSVARQMNVPTISAYVTEVQTRVPLSPDVQPDELIVKAEYAAFLEETSLDQLRPSVDLSVSQTGQYDKLRELIEVHGYVAEAERGQPLENQEAVLDWYDQNYLPVILTIRERGMLRDFPGRTETDLYLWLTEHSAELSATLGWEVQPQNALADLAHRFSPRYTGLGHGLLRLSLPSLADGPAAGEWRKERLTERYVNRLFSDVLVPLSGEPESWVALEQAIEMARREQAHLLGLHIVADEAARTSENALAVQVEFEKRCEAAGVPGKLALEVGTIGDRICERAILADLVVVNLAHPPGHGPLERLGSGFRALVRRCPRPILAVPSQATPMEKLLLAYDGSAKAKEALFVATYLVGNWHSQLTIAIGTETTAMQEAREYAEKYLEFHEITASWVEMGSPVPQAFLKLAEETQAEMLLMGGYGARPVVEVVLGSTVDRVLRETYLPTLICR